MNKLLRNALIALALIVTTGAAAAAYLLQDANRFKPQLEALIASHGGVPLTVGGDLSWRLWPPLSLSAEALSADYQGQTWQVGRLTLDLDAVNVARDPNDWTVQSLTLEDVTLRRDDSVLEIHQARLEELAPNRPAPLTAELSYAARGDAEPIAVTLAGDLTVDPRTLTLGLRQARIETTDGVATCDLSAHVVADPPPAAPANADDLVPVDVLLGYAWKGHCTLDWVEFHGHRFEQVSLDLENDGGNSLATLQAPRFFGGEAVADVAIDARRTPLRWTLRPTLSRVDSHALMEWLDQDVGWAAPLASVGSFTMEGNSTDALLSSLSGETRFDGGQGSIDIAEIRGQLLELAELFHQGDRIRGWPETWQYQKFVGDWRIDRQHHQLTAALDNLSVTGQGDYQPLDDALDLGLDLTFGNDPSLPVFAMDPVLYDLPIPVRCRGTLAEPACRLDGNAAQGIAARALGDENSELRGKLERKIDEQVPEQYRDAARALLDALGSGLQSRSRDP